MNKAQQEQTRAILSVGEFSQPTETDKLCSLFQSLVRVELQLNEHFINESPSAFYSKIEDSGVIR